MPGSELEIRTAVTTGCLFPPPDHELALRNALRYFPPDTQELLAPEFAQELRLYGHIYMYRFCPDIEMKYGQMTAGSYCYIGPQGIVHGTVLTVLNAGRRYLGVQDLAGKVFVTSGLGGMSGAQAKAAVIVGCVGVIAEVDGAALMKRHKQGWLMEVTDSLDRCIERLRERLVRELDTTGELLVDLGSDQTSCHNPFNGGYYPVQLGFAEAQSLMASDPAAFKALVQESLRRHVSAINRLAQENFFFWDYGNAFLLEAQRAGADVGKTGADRTEFRYPSYVQHIMGDIFSQGFGPFRWVCTSGDPQDLAVTDQLATSVLEEAIAGGVNPAVEQQYMDNIRWIREASRHRLVVGSQARILYSDQKGRVAIAVAFNQAIARGKIKAPVVLSRDHHDVSGTDSPFRETSNIRDGSAFCADMAVQNFVGGAFRGATWVALHNGGGVGWGEVINGGFGLVLDGTQEAEQKAKMMLSWDVSNGTGSFQPSLCPQGARAVSLACLLACACGAGLQPSLRPRGPEGGSSTNARWPAAAGPGTRRPTRSSAGRCRRTGAWW
ncbi:urocanate hydratase isoform X1 [Lagenorhynchus albirostris]|uniref:urocanate hydratase isoform X1 n=1 Tax=Lagenorhynchus albirostris TaxID=27610 RepID=UPI0028E690D1|nr:urocanate hydratase isoform X1 [Lagenorhynchus albirostris]